MGGTPPQKVKCAKCRNLVEYVFVNGYCKECTLLKIHMVNTQLKQKKGFYFNKWRARSIATLKRM